MNIVYCGDNGTKDGLLVSILSLIKNAEEVLNIYIMTLDYQDSVPIADKTVEFLDDLVKKSGEENFVKKINATEAFLKNPPEKNLNTFFTKKYFKPCAMLRLYMDQIPELKKLDRILYLDYDVICRKDPAEFYNIDMTNIEVAGTLDIYGKNFYHYNRPSLLKGDSLQDLKEYKPDYMNSGVLLFNMRECKASSLFPRAVEICRQKRMMLADQAALNMVIRHRRLMPNSFNEQQDHPEKDTVFHHFSNNFKFKPYFHVQKIKPFEVDKVHEILGITEYDDILNEYLKLKDKL